MRVKQLRPRCTSMAYVLLCALHRVGLAHAHTQFAPATCGTIHLKLPKIGALVQASMRRIKVAIGVSEFLCARCRSVLPTIGRPVVGKG